jgi:membrane protease YdiL (CAAX protease family)
MGRVGSRKNLAFLLGGLFGIVLASIIFSVLNGHAPSLYVAVGLAMCWIFVWGVVRLRHL